MQTAYAIILDMHARSLTEAGFTIVETLIVLAISGLMVALAISSMDGSQQQTEFNTGVDTLTSELNQQLSSVNDGNYLPLGQVNCTTNGGTTPVFGGVTANGSCTIVGEIIAFNTGSSPQSFTVLPVIGRNYVSGSTTLATDITETIPQISSLYDQVVDMPFALTLDSNYSGATIAPGKLGALGVFSFTSFEGGTSVSSGNLNSGSSHIELFAIPGSSTTESISKLTSSINGNGVAGNGLVNCGANNASVCIGSATEAINPIGGIEFCTDSGSNNDSALFTLGGPNSSGSVSYKIYSKLGC